MLEHQPVFYKQKRKSQFTVCMGCTVVENYLKNHDNELSTNIKVVCSNELKKKKKPPIPVTKSGA